jgi:hypothetical protein
MVENCVTTVFSAYVTANGQAWADFDVYMPDRWARDLPRRHAAGIPDDLEFATKPRLAMNQLERLAAPGLPIRWAAVDEVYGRSGELRKSCAKAGLAYVAIIPCDYPVTTVAGIVIRADEAVPDAVFERRSCGTGAKGPRISDWAMTGPGERRPRCEEGCRRVPVVGVGCRRCRQLARSSRLTLSMRTPGGEVISCSLGQVAVRRQLVGGVSGRLRCCTCVLYGAWHSRHAAR